MFPAYQDNILLREQGACRNDRTDPGSEFLCQSTPKELATLGSEISSYPDIGRAT